MGNETDKNWEQFGRQDPADAPQRVWTRHRTSAQEDCDRWVKGEVVRIRRHVEAVILEPIPTDWVWLDALAGTLDADFVQAVAAQPAPQERHELTALFP